MKILFKEIIMVTCLMGSMAKADMYVIGVHPASAKSPSFGEVGKIMMNLKLGDRFRFYNLKDLSLVASIDLPKNKTSYKNHRVLLDKFKNEFKAVKVYIKDVLIRKEDNEIGTHFLFPEFLNELSVHEIKQSEKTHILVIGSGIYNDPREPHFSMANGHFPTDGHLNTDIRQSVFSTQNKINHLKNTQISYVYSDRFVTDIHLDRVNRFWDLFIKSQNGKLVSFTHNLKTGLRRFLEKDLKIISNNNLDSSDSEVSMIKINRLIKKKTETNTIYDGIGWLKDNVKIYTGMPDKYTGTLKIGIRWKCGSCDYDLWVKSNQEREWLFFRNKRTSDGYFNKDYLNSPDNANSLEYVGIERKMDIRDLNIKVNLYAGSLFNDRHGEVRAYFNGKVYSTPFKTSARTGNKGANYNNPDGDAHWFVVDVKKLFNIN